MYLAILFLQLKERESESQIFIDFALQRVCEYFKEDFQVLIKDDWNWMAGWGIYKITNKKICKIRFARMKQNACSCIKIPIVFFLILDYEGWGWMRRTLFPNPPVSIDFALWSLQILQGVDLQVILHRERVDFAMLSV